MEAVIDRFKKFELFEAMLFAWMVGRATSENPPTQRNSIREFLRYFHYSDDDVSVRAIEAVYLRKRKKIMGVMRAKPDEMVIRFVVDDAMNLREYIETGFLKDKSNEFEFEKAVEREVKKRLKENGTEQKNRATDSAK